MNLVICEDGTGCSEQHSSSIYEIAFRYVSHEQQLVYYSPGGLSLLESIFGTDINRRIDNGYRFIVQNYKPGDQIYLFGYSRGAYIVRRLARKLAYRFPIKFLGVFDTVISSYPLSTQLFANNELSWTVQHAVHALSYHERREAFTPWLWHNAHTHPDAEQRWFPGVHGDLGGLYPDDKGLGDYALQYVLDKAIAQGLITHNLDQLKPDLGVIHNSHSLLWRCVDKLIPRLQHPNHVINHQTVLDTSLIKNILHDGLDNLDNL